MKQALAPDASLSTDVILEVPAKPGKHVLALDLAREHVCSFSIRGVPRHRVEIIGG